MRLSVDELSQVVAKSSTLSERLSGEVEPDGGDQFLATRRLARWKHLSGGTEEAFASTLSSAGARGLSEDILISKMGSVRRRADAPWPSWAILLNDLVANLSEIFAGGEHARCDQPFPSVRGAMPFAHIYQHVAAFAWDHLTLSPIQLTSNAVTGLKKLLLDRLSDVASLPLHTLFLSQKALDAPQANWTPLRPAAVTSVIRGPDAQYRAFVSKMGMSGLRDFVLLYPAAARLVAEAILLWIEYVDELLERSQTDRAELACIFGGRNGLGKITAIEAGLSDPHYRGRVVAILRFEGGLRVVYKPRPLRVDELFFELIKSLNDAGFEPALRPLKTLDRSEYGWMEFASHSPCKNKRAARGFYRRAGALVCLVHWLHGVDLHRENVVASADQPMLVDLEALAHPAVPTPASGDGRPKVYLSDTILRCGLLPYWQTLPRGGAFYDNSALGAPVYQSALVSSTQWLNVNTDQMNWAVTRRICRHTAHRPRIKSRVLYAQKFAADILCGHQTMEAMLSSRDDQRFTRLRFEIFGSVRRRIRRPTVVYAILLRRSLRPDNLAEGIDRSLTFQGLPPDVTSEQERAQEIMSLEKLDVPYFRFSSPVSYLESDSVLDQGEYHHQQRRIITAAVRRQVTVRDGVVETISGRAGL